MLYSHYEDDTHQASRRPARDGLPENGFSMQIFTRALPVAAALLLGACSVFGGGDDSTGQITGVSQGGRGLSGNERASLGVNAYLWRASLETLDFMPLSEVDPFGGLIITDWYTNPNSPQERFKATVYILDQQLRADALKVTIHRQIDRGTGYIDEPTATETEVQIENAILTRARQLRVSNLE